MSVAYCFYCDRYIDTDFDVEHFPVQEDGCYDENKCVKYYDEILTPNEVERMELRNEVEFSMQRYFKGYELSPIEVSTIRQYNECMGGAK